MQCKQFLFFFIFFSGGLGKLLKERSIKAVHVHVRCLRIKCESMVRASVLLLAAGSACDLLVRAGVFVQNGVVRLWLIRMVCFCAEHRSIVLLLSGRTGKTSPPEKK